MLLANFFEKNLWTPALASGLVAALITVRAVHGQEATGC